MLDVNASGDDLVFTWASSPARAYTLHGNTDLASPPLSWSAIQSEIPATPPLNTLTIPRPADPAMFYAIEEHAPPPLFTDDFETDLGWTTGSEGDPGTLWERGTPTLVGPLAAFSPVNCFGTNLASNYGTFANVWLRSPVIDLTGPGLAGGTLKFQQFKDFEDFPFEEATVTFLDASDGTPLAPPVPFTAPSIQWSEATASLPSGAIGKSIIIEFRFQSDDQIEFAGWYIDDVKVSVQ
jgi:hypothetical protein